MTQDILAGLIMVVVVGGFVWVFIVSEFAKYCALFAVAFVISYFVTRLFGWSFHHLITRFFP